MGDQLDFGRRSDDYGRHRPGFPPSFYDRLERLGTIQGRRALDLGTGTGFIALELAKRGAQVTGIDVAAEQIRVASERVETAGLADRCSFRIASAERTALPTGEFDWITAGQCWHWFDQPRVLHEVQRLLKQAGLFVIAHYSYLADHSEVARMSEELVLQHNPSWTMAGSSGMYPEQVDQLVAAGFELVEQFCYHHDEEFTREDWRGRMRTCNGVGSRAVSEEAVRAYDRDLQELLDSRFGELLVVPHRVWAVVARKPRD